MKQIIFFLLLSIAFIAESFAQQTPQRFRRTIDYKTLTDTSRDLDFVETDPPTGEVRFVAEFEPMQGVMIRYPLGIPESLVADFSTNCQVYCIVANSCQNEAFQTFVEADVDMDRVTFVNAPTESFFVRDYGPWYIFEDKQPAIVDNLYYPEYRPKDDSISWVFSEFWNIPMYGMNLRYEGGNMMEDGRGQGVSDAYVVYSNNNDEEDLRNKIRDYLGIEPLHLLTSNYFGHVDCWGKYLAPDKILIAKLPENDHLYSDFEGIAHYFSTTNCCWGYPYRVYRVDIPNSGQNTVAPYTNSLILNKTVYLPMGTDSVYNQNAIAVYQEAMPGYEILAFEGSENTPWVAGDALHCRTRGVMDFDMLFVDHRDVIFGEQDWQDSIAVTSKFIAYSGANLKQDSLLVYYSIDGGTYQVAHMTATGNPDEYVGYIKGYQGESEINYYVFGADESGHRYTQPVFADLDPHHFTMEAHQPSGDLIVAPDTLWFEHNLDVQVFTIENQTNVAVQINSITDEGGYLWPIEQIYYPITIQAGETLSFNFTFSYPQKTDRISDDYVSTTLTIQTSIGEKHLTAMIRQSAMVNLVYYNEMYFEDPSSVRWTMLQNKSVFIPTIKVLSITEKDTDYLNIETTPTPPFDLNFNGDDAEIIVSLKDFAKGYVNTSIEIKTDYGVFEIAVYINEDILTVSELSAEAKLYPNPTTGQFTVEGANIAKVEVFNLVGQMVCEQQGSKVVNIDAADWNKGIYLVNIIEENGAVVTKKLVVK